jgi:hypothetical protein
MWKCEECADKQVCAICDGSGDRKVETSLFKILDMVNLFRDEQGTLGSLARKALADMIGYPPTKEEVIAFLDYRSRKNGTATWHAS